MAGFSQTKSLPEFQLVTVRDEREKVIWCQTNIAVGPHPFWEISRPTLALCFMGLNLDRKYIVNKTIDSTSIKHKFEFTESGVYL